MQYTLGSTCCVIWLGLRRHTPKSRLLGRFFRGIRCSTSVAGVRRPSAFVLFPPFLFAGYIKPIVVLLHRDPDDADHNVHTLALAAIVLEAPHAVRLLVPEGLGSRVHPTASNVRLAVGGRSTTAIAGTDARLFSLVVAAALGPV